MSDKVNRQNNLTPSSQFQSLIELSLMTPAESLAALNTSWSGLNDEEANARLEQYGANEMAHDKPIAWYLQLLTAFITPFNGVLAAISLVSFFTDVIFASGERSFKTIIVLATMILLSTLLRFWQEFRSTSAAEKLKFMVHTAAALLRSNMERPEECPISILVPGDIVHLAAGDMIPADVVILSAKDLFVSQAMLTGESIPIEKRPAKKHLAIGEGELLERENLCFMGTNVVSGFATVLVATTGNNTYFGRLAKNVVGMRQLTSFDIGINKISWMLIRFVIVMTPIVFMINGITKGNWTEALLFSISVAVGLTPEMLPMVVTANLARGAVMMSRRGCIVKRLNAIQNFGAMNILCTDKTGTLTQNKVILERHLDIFGGEDKKVLEYAWLNSFHQTGLRNLLDTAVIEYAKEHGVAPSLQHYWKVDEVPFDFVRRRMSVIVRDYDKDENLLICKGAMEELLSLCDFADDRVHSYAEIDGGKVKFTDHDKDAVREIAHKLNAEGLRVIAVAYKWLEAKDHYSVEDEEGLTFAGYIAFLDPPKESATAAISALKTLGVGVKILTGDNEVVTYRTCHEVGLEVNGKLLGSEVEAMSNQELINIAPKITIFAKMSPLQKSRVIAALKSGGNTVGYLGDGINDAPALKEADVGISVDSAVDIAREAADIILLEKSLMVLEQGVVEGRKTFANIVKYIKMTASSNFGNVLSILVASIFLPFMPMLPIQLLVQNLLYDISQISIPWDHVDEDYLKKPRKWDAGGIARFMFCVGPISSIFDVVTFVVMWNIFGANSSTNQSLFQSGWFVVGLLTQILIVHMIRTKKVPFIESCASLPVIVMTTIIMVIGIYIPFSSLGLYLKMVPLPSSYFLWLVMILFGYCALIQTVKKIYIKKFKQWL